MEGGRGLKPAPTDAIAGHPDYNDGMNDLLQRITIKPEQCGGRPCIRGMRIRVTDVLELFAAGLSAEQILKEFPDLEPEDIQACLSFAARKLDHPVVVP
jgi:uncharacterized protein (DUF433 family)